MCLARCANNCGVRKRQVNKRQGKREQQIFALKRRAMYKIVLARLFLSLFLSKKFEEVYRGTITDVLVELEEPKGEFVIVVEGTTETVDYTNVSVIEHVNSYIKEGNSVNTAIGLVAKQRNVSKKEIYNEYHGINK